jgi:hypothetical protein
MIHLLTLEKAALSSSLPAVLYIEDGRFLMDTEAGLHKRLSLKLSILSLLIPLKV